VRIYLVDGHQPDERVVALTERVSIRPAVKMQRTAYHVYVNSRPLLRAFRDAQGRVPQLPIALTGPYFAGRFDGDGAARTERFPGIRIAYSTELEAQQDAQLLDEVDVETSVLFYSKANEYCVYVKKSSAERFESLIASHSWKAHLPFHPVETAMAPLTG
jgi:hypothetical protein